MDLTPLTMIVNGKALLFSACDAHYFNKGVHIASGGYVGCGSILVHRLILGLSNGDKKRADHINRNRLDNRRENLRLCDARGNAANRAGYPGSSKFKGVTFRRSCGKWEAAIRTRGKTRYLGVFIAEEDAARVYDTAALELFGEFAFLNFPMTASL